ncbi:YqjF family protein [Kribbella sp. CA-247076]|uniref:YqjF family protein n=1 Tax=Kribbella sp. CA-247076 TaxID=3239941 RepID=UPI003D8F083C
MDTSWPEAPPLRRPRILRQGWRELTFLHWAVDPSTVAHFFPPGVRPDTFEGRTYVGLVPFRMVGTGLPHGPAVPYFGSFLETNIRLYSVDRSGRRGVVFLSLDTDRLAVVGAARSVFGLPYRWAAMTHSADGNQHTYTSILRHPGVRASSRIGVRVGESLDAGPLEHFLTARWGLHIARAGRTWYLPNHHPPWVLQTAELVTFDDHGLLASVGLTGLNRSPDHVAYSSGVPAEFGLPLRL